MDRREALKKLAAGGAIVAGGSIVLSSNAVAQACSPLPVAPANPFKVVEDKTILLTDNGFVLGGTPGYNWRINSYAQQETRILVRRDDTTVVLGPKNDEFTAPPSTPFGGTFLGPAFIISRGDEFGSPDDLLAPKKAEYSLSVLVTWTFTSGCQPLVQEYTILGEGRKITSITKLS